MSTVVDRLTGRLYRVGLRHERGASSLVCLAARPARITVGEVAASVADVVASRTRDRTDPRVPEGVGPSTV